MGAPGSWASVHHKDWQKATCGPASTPSCPRPPARLRRHLRVPRCPDTSYSSSPLPGQRRPFSLFSLGHGNNKTRLVASFASGCSKRTRHWLSGNLASGWVLLLPCCVTLASYFPSLGLGFSLCKRKQVIPASLISIPPDDFAV